MRFILKSPPKKVRMFHTFKSPDIEEVSFSQLKLLS